jgi:hypothetical protein
VTTVVGKEIETRQRLYRSDRPPLEVAGRIVILVDDGILIPLGTLDCWLRRAPASSHRKASDAGVCRGGGNHGIDINH